MMSYFLLSRVGPSSEGVQSAPNYDISLLFSTSLLKYTFFAFLTKERQTNRQTDRDTDTDRQRDTDTDRHRQTQTDGQKRKEKKSELNHIRISVS